MLEIRSHYLETMPDGSPKGLRVILGNDEGAIYPVLLSSNLQDKAQAEVLEAAREVMYQKEFSGRAEKEQFQRLADELSELRQGLKTTDKKIGATDKKVKDLEAQVVNLKSAQTKVQHEVEVEVEIEE